MSVSPKSFQIRSNLTLKVNRPKPTTKNIGLGLQIHLGMKLKAMSDQPTVEQIKRADYVFNIHDVKL